MTSTPLPLDPIRRKIFPCKREEEFVKQLNYWRFKGFRLVFTNGCFDLLHPGHVDYLYRSSVLGDVLIIGLNTDDSVKRLKGPQRPVNQEMDRAMLLAAMSFTSAVVSFDQDTPLELIRLVQPDILVKGGDYRPEDVVGYELVKARGGKVITLDLLPGYSSTNLIDRIAFKKK